MRIGIYGYGNLGRGVECAIKYNPDIELVGIFTRRAPESVKTLTGAPVYSAEAVLDFKDKIDVKIRDYDGSWSVTVTGITEKTATLYINIVFSDGTVDKALTYTINAETKTDSVKVNEEALEKYLSDEPNSSDTNSSSSGTDA